MHGKSIVVRNRKLKLATMHGFDNSKEIIKVSEQRDAMTDAKSRRTTTVVIGISGFSSHLQ